VKIVAITKDGRELHIVHQFHPEFPDLQGKEIIYDSLKDAAGDFRGDYLNELCEQHPDEKIVEFRLKYEFNKCFDTECPGHSPER
jgi:hypothetical protein